LGLAPEGTDSFTQIVKVGKTEAAELCPLGHRATLRDAAAKTQRFRYSDVFGFYYDRPLCRTLGIPVAQAKQFHIGNHDVNALTLG